MKEKINFRGHEPRNRLPGTIDYQRLINGITRVISLTGDIEIVLKVVLLWFNKKLHAFGDPTLPPLVTPPTACPAPYCTHGSTAFSGSYINNTSA